MFARDMGPVEVHFAPPLRFEASLHNLRYPLPAAGVKEIPAILRGEKPSSSDPEAAELATNNRSNQPVAAILGGGYEEEDAKAMREACKGHLNVPWLMFDKDKPAGVPLGPEYAKIVVGGGKPLLKKLKEEGKLGEDAVNYY
ncbi:hypothetical protein OEA41_006160 [Lepraria neglecta]|uniref:Uncharacterized protein n=1 Tax=Lepraria neglecta TaxID=209136 RepID=A0AAD9Z771_9LECA|nr:hypothetical protein OEA41_006160 [Lepraria neglecta]